MRRSLRKLKERKSMEKKLPLREHIPSLGENIGSLQRLMVETETTIIPYPRSLTLEAIQWDCHRERIPLTQDSLCFILTVKFDTIIVSAEANGAIPICS